MNDIQGRALCKRADTFSRIQEKIYDVIIIGGGATGAGIALDAASRGLKPLILEKGDFSSGTSSKSTKLIHGGVRYLEQAVWGLDKAQYDLVVEALAERATMIQNAPYLARSIRLLTPLYRWWQLPYYWLGLKVYDWLSGSKSLGKSHFISKQRTLQRFPGLQKKNLKGSVVYYDGQFNDARYNIVLVRTAEKKGADVLNYTEVTGLIKEEKKVVGVTVTDFFSKKKYKVQSKVVINATGPYVDHIRQLDDATLDPIIQPSIGVHLVLDQQLSPLSTGLFVPQTADGRVLFLLPWEGKTLIGTTDQAVALTPNPKPSKEDILYLLGHLQPYFSERLRLKNVRSEWAGLRPLVSARSEKESSTAKLVRDHHLEVSKSGLVTISGGKWTTYRKMAEDALDCAVQVGDLHPKYSCCTKQCPLVGTEGYHHTDWKLLMLEFGIEETIARHLSSSYGAEAKEVAELMQKGYDAYLAPGYPFIEAEIVWAIKNEYACQPADILLRRTRLSMLDTKSGEIAAQKMKAFFPVQID